MAACIKTLSTLVKSHGRQFNLCLQRRRIMTSTSNLDKALGKLQDNPYYEKYAARIAQLQQTSPEEFLERVEGNLTKNDGKQKKIASVDTRQFSSVLHPKEALKDDALAKENKLDSIFKIDLVKDKDAEEIQTIWEEYHKNKEVISATIPVDTYKHIHDNMKQYHTFLFPLPRSQGYEFMLCQSYGDTLHFTPLLAYQVHKENAPECLKIVHYTELSHKGLVLMRGEYDKNVLNGKEAQCLANQFQMYYNGKDDNKLQLLKIFMESPDSFKHMDLISHLENIGLS